MWHDETDVWDTDLAVACKLVGAETRDKKVPGGCSRHTVTRWGWTLVVGGKSIELYLMEDNF